MLIWVFLLAGQLVDCEDTTTENGDAAMEANLPLGEFLETTGFTGEQYSMYVDFQNELSQIANYELSGGVLADPVDTNIMMKETSDKSLPVPLFQGDIVLQEEQMSEILTDIRAEADVETDDQKKRKKRKLTSNRSARWSLPIKYRLSGAPTSAVAAGISLWEQGTCVTFRQTSSSSGSHLRFIRGSGCFSSVGVTGSRGQDVSIGFGCETPAIVAHEIGHALGFWHEQSRPDRDSFVSIQHANIPRRVASNFGKQSSRSITTFGIPYDLGSVMHYGPKAFSSSGRPTILSRDSKFQQTMGQRRELSFIDVKLINAAYCAGVCRRKLRCLHNGYTDPKNCNICRCPKGFGGTLCERSQSSSSNCGTTDLTASGSAQAISFQGRGSCSWFIKAPAGTNVILDITQLGFSCRTVCESSYTEVRYKRDLSNTGARLCCQNPGRVKSDTNEMMIIFRGSGSFSATFRSSGTPVATLPPTVPKTTQGPITGTAFWNNWSAWSRCTMNCGGCGKQFRSRGCTIPGRCIGDATDQRSCNQQKCITTAVKVCTKKYLGICGRRYCVKTRLVPCTTTGDSCCRGYTLVSGSICVRTTADSQATTATPTYKWGEWGDFTECKGRQCGGCGTRSRTRTCAEGKCDGFNTDVQRCDMTPCTDCTRERDALERCADNPWRLCIKKTAGDQNCPCCKPFKFLDGMCLPTVEGLIDSWFKN